MVARHGPPRAHARGILRGILARRPRRCRGAAHGRPVGERRTPAGRRKLVVVGAGLAPAGFADEPGRLFCVTKVSIDPATFRSAPAALRSQPHVLFLAPDHVLRVFAGQPDPLHPERFTIRYEVNGSPGTIDGTLDEYGAVWTTVRDGPLAGSGG